jgi:RibD C-terminal domain
MAKLIVSILRSLDGYWAKRGGRLDALPMGPAFDAHNLGLMHGAGVFVFGAKAFAMFEAYWPTVDRSPSGDPVEREISERFDATPKIVISDTLVVPQTSP